MTASEQTPGLVAPRRPRGLLWPTLAAALCCLLLIGLGVWQLRRLAWKEGLIADIAARAGAAPAPLPLPAQWSALQPDAYEYRHVFFDGVFDHAKEALVFRPSAGGGPEAGAGPGYLVLTPLRLDSGAFVIVNRGFVPQARKDPAQRRPGEIQGSVHVEGLMRAPESRNPFTPADRPDEGAYFTKDPQLIAAHHGLSPAAPFIVDADFTAAPGGGPQGGATALSVPNNHFSYALTWFGLAGGLMLVFAAYVHAGRAGQKAPPPETLP